MFLKGRSGIALRKVELLKLSSPAAKQTKKDFKFEAVPYIRIYDANGTCVYEKNGATIQDVTSAMEKRP